MPTKRRQKGKVRGKQSRSKDVSSEDMDSHPSCTSQKSLKQLSDITDKLAKKRLKSSTDTEVEQHEQKENFKRHGCDGYDADFETSEFDATSAGSDMDCQSQPHLSKVADPRSVLSAHPSNNKKEKSTGKGKLQKAALLKRSRKALVQDTLQCSPAPHCQKDVKMRGHRKMKRDTASLDSVGQPAIPANTAALLTSPEMMHLFPNPNGSDSSTPLSGIADSKSDANDSCFGFEGLLSPQPALPFSPVLPDSPSFPAEKGETFASKARLDIEDQSPSPSPSPDLVLRLSPSPEPPSPDHDTRSSMSTMYSSVASMSASMQPSRVSHKRRLDIDLTGLVPKDDEEGPPKKASKKRKPQKKKEEEAWALKMSTEFDDIEMFELTVE
ncbi:uncharacterized protein [Diadema antillarum]|uniref:uncharacterized protein n=1 Tax=Diadema antillarum TaxID=105358 RepID=UPI003A857CDE